MSLFIHRLFLLTIICVIGIFFASFFEFAINIPKWDDFALIQSTRDFHTTDGLFDKFRLLFKQHNEHRIALSRFLAISDYYIFGQLNFVHLMFVGSLGLLGIFGVFIAVAKNNIQNYLLITILSFLWFSLAFYENTFWGMAAIQNFWVITLILLLFYLLSFKSQHFILICFIGFISIFTSGNGLLVIPIVGFYYLIDQNFKKLAYWSIFSIVLIVLYFFSYSPPPDTAHSNFHLFDFMKGVFVMSGSMIEGLPIQGNFFSILLVFGGIFMLFSTFVIIRLLIKNLVQRQPLSQEEKFILLGLLFTCSTIFLVSFSRVGNYGVNSLLVSRYKIYSILLISLLILYFSNAYQNPLKLRWQIIVSVFCLFWYLSIQHYFIKNVVDQKRFLISFAFNYLKPTEKSTSSKELRVYEPSALPLDFASSHRKVVNTNYPFLKFNENHSLNFIEPYGGNQLLGEGGLYVLLVNSSNRYVFPFVQSRKHSIRNLLNYSNYFVNSGELTLNLKESEILPGEYELKLVDGQKILDFHQRNLIVPNTAVKQVQKNW